MNALDNRTKVAIAEIEKAIEQAKSEGKNTDAMYGAAAVVIAAIATAASDRSAKKEIKTADDEVQEFLDALTAYSYRYKDPTAFGTKDGRIIGIMAQDLEDSDIGRQFVRDTPHGKLVDYGQGLAAILASQAHLNDRVNTLAARL
jgi:hypothetical protein